MKAPRQGISFDAEVVRVIDGDTVEVETRLRHRVRLEDCWCKEVRLGPNTTPDDKVDGLEAKAFLQELLLSSRNRVRVFIPGNGGDLFRLSSLSRVIGRLWRRFPIVDEDDCDVSELMVQSGHATATKEPS
jgi:endonuclease YncB( thermonuclease family)